MDIVERLRAKSGTYDEYDWHSEIELEAADEIERLRHLASKYNLQTLDAAADDIERLRKENQQLLDECNTWAREVKTEQRLSFRNQVAQLEEQLAACQLDAERYRWLRETMCEFVCNTGIHTVTDAAIDAAMKEQTK